MACFNCNDKNRTWGEGERSTFPKEPEQVEVKAKKPVKVTKILKVEDEAVAAALADEDCGCTDCPECEDPEEFHSSMTEWPG